jgi:AhpD family alkylhydroperoxidase
MGSSAFSQEYSQVEKFRRRIYHRWSEFAADLRFILAHRQQMRSLMRGEWIDTAFRERLMLAVTAVHGCRYCSYVHAKQALVYGMSSQEIEALRQGALKNSPAQELSALLYAQHWAETNAKPDSEARARVLDEYGQDTVEAIELALRTIRVGNLLGNTFDYLLYRVSFGHWGGSPRSPVSDAAEP